MFLTRIAVGHPVFTTMIMLALVVFGAFSYNRMAVEQIPSVDFPVVAIMTTYSGASPEAVESEVTKPIEEAVNTVNGLDTIQSQSFAGRSIVIVLFNLEVDSATAAQDVRDKIAGIQGNLPGNADAPQVLRFDPSESPILSFAVSSSTLSDRQLTALVEDTIIKRLQIVPGVGRATLVGGVPRQINILVDPDRLSAFGVSVQDVLNALGQDNIDLPAGAVRNGSSVRQVQVEGQLEQLDQFNDIIVARRGGQPVRLADVASIDDGQADAGSIALLDDARALAVDVIKIQGANTVGVAEEIRHVLEELAASELPEGVQIDIVRDNSTTVEQSLHTTQSTLLEGALLAIVIVYVFLNSWRSTVITALTLPISLIGTITVIAALGFTLNTMTLLALTLSIGMVIDDAIVVRENITRHLHMGKSHLRAALDGTNEIGLAVMATTATIVAVFLPVAFMEGIIGRFFFEFGVTVSAAVLISLFVAFTLDPMLSSVWYDPDAQPDAKRGPIGRTVARFEHAFDWLGGQYKRLIGWTLRHRFITLMATVGVFVGSILMVPLVGVEFVPNADEGRFQINVTAPVGSSLDYTAAKVDQVEGALREFPEVAAIYSTVNTGSAMGKHKAALLVRLVPHADRTETPATLAGPIRERLATIPGIDIAIVQEGLGGGQSPIQLSVLGDDRSVLEEVAGDLAQRMRAIPGMVDVASSAEETSAIVSVRLKREAASDLGIGVQQLGNMLSPLVGGEEVTNWTDALGETYEVVVRLPAEQRADTAALGELMMTTGSTDASGAPVMVRLDQVAEIGTVHTASEIRRLNMSREVLVTADVSGRTLGDATTDLQAVIADMEVPAGYSVRFGGQAENMQDTMGSMVTALAMAIIFIYIVLASQFGSFMQPIAIMAALPLSLVGVILGLMASGSTINMFSLIGFIMLMGLVTKNGILLVDFANQERRRGLPLNEALVSAGAIRFRPIVMTTLAMIFGMIPLALAVGGGGAQRAPMAHAVIGGLISSTVLTLVVVPVILSYIDSITRRVSRYLPKAPDDHGHGHEEQPAPAVSHGPQLSLPGVPPRPA